MNSERMYFNETVFNKTATDYKSLVMDMQK
jgi:hypothetical protein